MRAKINDNVFPLTRPRLADAVLLVLLIALTILSPRLIPARSTGDTLHVQTPDSVFEVSLADDWDHPVEGPLGPAVLMVRNGKAWLRNAPCPLKICERMGPIDESGEVILCVPNRIHIEVTGSGGVDAISR